MADAAIDAVHSGDIKIRPETAEKFYFHWFGNDHRVPAYFVKFETEADGNGSNQTDDDSELWVTGCTEEEAYGKAAKKYPGHIFQPIRDADVLDTWFSSTIFHSRMT
ncbi:hypothetical protein AJ80_01851 [Polytolypa hystricis UAMH7299]|uniref:valine--tRNA ligase n=1 Tax=Polytolypa hystricis (strain UAMH7299) TaxID=1447883 RepID=A0A2B7Z127_POLH7|nr:hypothetical protein AJ80_01851 [Polytolypa hystricis UAMH7299]